MNEDLLQFLWKFKLFESHDLKDTRGNSIEILQVGKQNLNEGPDFLEASIRYDGMSWKGPIEIHVRSSDWEHHHHESHPLYQNLILHVVYEQDKNVPYFEDKNIPTLVLKNYIPSMYIQKYKQLQYNPNSLACNGLVDEETLEKWPMDLWITDWVFEKWQDSFDAIKETYELLQQNWEATLWVRMAYTMGLQINASIFEQMCMDLPIKYVQQTAQKEMDLLALLHGKAGLLEEPIDEFQQELHQIYTFLKHKYQLKDRTFSPRFLRLRPAAFPTIRLALLANLYHQYPKMFTILIQIKSAKELREIFQSVRAFPYFDTHYSYGKVSKFKEKKMSKGLIDSVLINAVLPIQFAYYQMIGKSIEPLLEILSQLPFEKNHVTRYFKESGFYTKNALHSQAYIQQYKSRCSEKKCLFCSLGLQIIKQ